MMKPSKIPHPGRFPPDVQLELLPFHLCWLPPLQQLGHQELPRGWGRQRQGKYLPGDKKCWELQEFKPPKRRETPCSLHHKSILLESGAIMCYTRFASENEELASMANSATEAAFCDTSSILSCGTGRVMA